MRLLIGVSKDRHGTFYAIQKVPEHLQEAVARVLDDRSSYATKHCTSGATIRLGDGTPFIHRRTNALQSNFEKPMDFACSPWPLRV